jgi:hypothetical protein
MLLYMAITVSAFCFAGNVVRINESSTYLIKIKELYRTEFKHMPYFSAHEQYGLNSDIQVSAMQTCSQSINERNTQNASLSKYCK